MALDEFKEKFNKLIDILTADEKIAEEFYYIGTVDESFDFACKLVGKMDRKRYYSAVKEYIESLDDDNSSYPGCKKLSSSDAKKVSGGMSFRHKVRT